MSPHTQSMPRVTVLIPVFNAERFLRESVKSVLAQTFANFDFELLAINDGSTDRSREILSSFSDPRVRIVDNDGNRGLIYTLNHGLELARGEYVARLDADDIAAPDRLAQQAAFLDQHPGVALVGGCAEFIDAEGKVFMTRRVPLTHDEIVARIFSVNCFIHSGVMFRTSVVRTLGGFRPEALHAEDYDLWLRIIERHDVANLPAVLVRYRVHPDQVSQRKLVLQRAAADRSRFAALARCRRADRVPAGVTAAHTYLWQRLRAENPSIGADYLGWMDTYRAMGRDDLADRLIAPAIAAAPLCGRLYRELGRPIIHAPRARAVMKALRWYRSKTWSLFRRRDT